MFRNGDAYFTGLSLWKTDHRIIGSDSKTVGEVKARFHETSKVNKTNHRLIQIDLWVQQTCRHRPMDIGAALADDQTSYFIIGQQEKCLFGQKLQYNVATN